MLPVNNKRVMDWGLMLSDALAASRGRCRLEDYLTRSDLALSRGGSQVFTPQ